MFIYGFNKTNTIFFLFLSSLKRKFYIGILFIAFSVLYSGLRMGMYFTYYLLDNEGFTENFCQNQDKPEMHCDGKCKLADVASENEKNNDFNFEKFATDFNWISHENFSYPIFIKQQDTQHKFYHKNPYWEKIHLAIFHPPIFV